MLKLHTLMVGGLVPWHPEAGGGQIIAYKTSQALARAGHDVHYLAIAPEGYERQLDWGELEYAPKGLGLLEALRLAPQLARSTHDDEYEIVHVHLANETIGHCLAYALARRMGLRPRIATSIYAPRAYALPRSLGEMITAFSSHSADLIFCLSEFSKRDISRAYHVPTSKLAVTYAGVDSTFTARRTDRDMNEDDPYTLLFCGRLNGPHDQKGMDVLLKSLPLILRYHKVALNIIGTGPRLPRYQALAADLGVAQHVRFLGFVEHQDMPRHYQQAGVFVLPSRRESFGLVLAEAMACGLPVVATKVGAIPEVVEDGVTGVLVPPDDPEGLASAITALLNDPQTMRAMGTRGRQRAETCFTWDLVAKRVIEGYERAL
jgi:glycosyltransferase involved in cell wall biosynthesis